MGIARLPRQIVVPSAIKPLADCTWEEISYVSQNNLQRRPYPAGRTFALSTAPITRPAPRRRSA